MEQLDTQNRALEGEEGKGGSDDQSTSLNGWRGWMHKEMPCPTVSISVTHLQFRSRDFTVLSSAFCTLHKEGNCACSFHSPEAVSYAQEMFNKCFNWSASAFSRSWLIPKSPCQTYVLHYISELYRFESRDENKTIFFSSRIEGTGTGDNFVWWNVSKFTSS